jgi:hypothetical protein
MVVATPGRILFAGCKAAIRPCGAVGFRAEATQSREQAAGPGRPVCTWSPASGTRALSCGTASTSGAVFAARRSAVIGSRTITPSGREVAGPLLVMTGRVGVVGPGPVAKATACPPGTVVRAVIVT